MYIVYLKLSLKFLAFYVEDATNPHESLRLLLHFYYTININLSIISIVCIFVVAGKGGEIVPRRI